ncbi:hypothetical protein CsSME_00001291 [Camellia sinensis var. sinensis]|uniref:Myb-like domain-containing protein n=1 Tax=Camellia sinensis var. sinensis TaxID=542762 RepID=A0A4S4DNZ9_CAMSN|nr:hypothetical protein TEA_029598 [Camellia sinensis var. sinensis]
MNNTQQIGFQERVQQNHGLVYDYSSLEHANQSSQFPGGCQMGICIDSSSAMEGGGSQQHNFGCGGHANSSSTIMSRISVHHLLLFLQLSVTWAFHNMSINLEIPLCPPNNPRIMICILHHIYLQGIVFISIRQSKKTPIRSPNLPCNLMQNPTFVAIKTTVLKRSYKTPCNNFSETEHIFLLKRKLLSDFGNSDMRQPSIPFERNRDLSHEHLRQSAARPAGGVSVTSGNTGSAISSKTQIRWTQDLHDRFVECVNHLGGAEKATPKAILKLIDSERLTIFHVKSHLQKYRIAKYMPDSAEGKSERKNNMNDAAQIDIKA